MNNKLKQALETAQRCRRNWDLSKSIPQEDIDILTHSVINSPTKQNEEFYSVTFITDRKIIEEIYEYTNIYTDMDMGHFSKNPQVLANLLVVFSDANPKTFRNDLGEYSSEETMAANKNMSIGIASGQLALTAAMLGYSTGFCKCFKPDLVGKVLNNSPVLMLGIGYPDNNKDRTVHQLYNKKYNTFNKPITVTTITSEGTSVSTVSGESVSKSYSTEIRFVAPVGIVLSGKGKHLMKELGMPQESIKQLSSDIEQAVAKFEVDTGYSDVDFDNSIIRFIWTSDDESRLIKLKEYIFSLDTIQTFIKGMTDRGWTIE